MAVSFKADHSRTSEYRAPSLSLKQQIQQVIESGKFPGIGGKQVEASDDLVEFLGRLIGRK